MLPSLRKLFRVVVVLASLCAVLWGAGTAALYLSMMQTPERFGAIMSHVPTIAMMVLPFRTLWMSARAGSLEVGDLAPDFALPVLDKTRSVRLSEEYRRKPVVLVFGSYTWPPFRSGVPELNRIYEKYQDQAAFYVVYIQEAHPTDLWQVGSNIREGVLFPSPRTDSERLDTATACVNTLGIKIPALLDGIENQTERAYAGWPDRLYVVDTNGRIRYKSAPGPFGFSTQELEQALVQTFSGMSRK